MIRDLFSGRLGVAKTFWFGSVAVIVAAQLVFYAFLGVYMQNHSEETYSRMDNLSVVITLALAAYLLLVVRALWKASFASRVPNGWGILGIIFTFYFVIRVGHSVITQVFPSVGTPTAWVEMQLRAIRSQLPQDLGDGFVLEHASINERELIYYIRANFSVEEVFPPEFESAVSIETAFGQEVCTDIQGYFKGGINKAIYEYTFDDGQIRSILTAKECYDWLDR